MPMLDDATCGDIFSYAMTFERIIETFDILVQSHCHNDKTLNSVRKDNRYYTILYCIKKYLL